MASDTAAGPPLAPPRRGFVRLLLSHPTGFWFIFFGELAERCSYYGMLSILARFIADELRLGQQNGTTITSLFQAGAYLFPLAGGYLADNFFGKYRLIVAFSLPYILGHVILTAETEMMTYLALTLLAMGSGVIKPNISTLMGLTYDQYRPGDEELRSSAFSLFYMAINIGSAVSFAVIPWMRDEYGYKYAFLAPAVLMAVSFLIFAAGKPFYATEVIAGRTKTPDERRQQLQVIRRVAGLFLLATTFWAMFNQTHNVWVFFANDYMNLRLLPNSRPFAPEQFGTVNPILIVLFVPLLTLLWNQLDTHFGLKVRATDKMVLGFFLTAVSMAIMAAAGYQAGTPVWDEAAGKAVVPDAARVSLWWEVWAYVFITLAEVLISVTGLELAFVVSPKSMKGFVTALWLFTVFLASLFINAPVGRLYNHFDPGTYFAMMAGGMLVVTVVAVFVARRFNRLAPTETGADRRPPVPPPTNADGVRAGYPTAGPSTGVQAGLPPE